MIRTTNIKRKKLIKMKTERALIVLLLCEIARSLIICTSFWIIHDRFIFNVFALFAVDDDTCLWLFSSVFVDSGSDLTSYSSWYSHFFSTTRWVVLHQQPGPTPLSSSSSSWLGPPLNKLLRWFYWNFSTFHLVVPQVKSGWTKIWPRLMAGCWATFKLIQHRSWTTTIRGRKA